MSNIKLTKQELSQLLKEAQKSHEDYEKELGAKDENWADWYAAFIIDRLQLETIVEAVDENIAANAEAIPRKVTRPISGSDVMSSPSDKSDQTQADKGATKDNGYACPTCGHRNRPGVLLCENCGTMLTTGAQPIGTRDLRDEDAVHQEELQPGDPRKATAKIPDLSQPETGLSSGESQAVASAGSNVFESNMVLRIEIEGGTTPILLHPKQQRDMILGRRDPTTGAMPDVDLTPYAGYRMGVSRRHSAMRLQDKQLDVWDLGSSNGTFLNGQRLSPHRPYRVKDGDEVRLGQMVLRVYFQMDNSR